MKSPPPLFLDHQSTTAVDPNVLESMIPWFSNAYGNASSRTHAYGDEAREAVDAARAEVGKLLGTGPRDIVFTSGATESNNLALFGAARFYQSKGRHIITVQTEHKAVLDPCLALEREGFTVTRLPVDPEGFISLSDLEKEINEQTILISVMAANNEIGTIQNLAAIGSLAKLKGVLFHTDAAQALSTLHIDVEACGIDLLSLSAHKIYGPKGVGALYIRRRNPRVRLIPVAYGGGQERDYRPGTLNVPGIVGLGAACSRLRQNFTSERKHLLALAQHFTKTVQDGLDGVHLNGPALDRVAGNVSLSFDGVSDGFDLLRRLPSLAISTGAACTTAIPEPSHVLRAIGVSAELAHATIRLGFGKDNTPDESNSAADMIRRSVIDARKDL